MKKSTAMLLLVLMLITLFLPLHSSAAIFGRKRPTIYMKVNQVKALKRGRSDQKYRWQSSNKRIVRTGKNGCIYAVRPGMATLYTRIRGKTYRYYVVVMKMNKAAISLKAGKTQKIKVKYGGKNVSWTSSDPLVATVKNGRVTAMEEGVAMITAKAHGKVFRCKVRVPSVTFSKTSITTNNLGAASQDTSKVSAKISTQNFNEKPVFRSSNNRVAVVTDEGGIIALKEGSAIISVSGDGLVYNTRITVTGRPVDVFLGHLQNYNEYVKKHAAYIERNETPEDTFADVQNKVSQGRKARINCRASICWAFAEMGITPHVLYAKKGTFKDKFKGDMTNYLTRITSGEVIGLNYRDAVDRGLLKPGDICCFKGRTHTFTYSGDGYKFYDGGTLTEMAGYDKIGFLLDYSKAVYNENRYINEVLRWKE